MDTVDRLRDRLALDEVLCRAILFSSVGSPDKTQLAFYAMKILAISHIR
jgi:hypothetical protein